jgi:hypothetical protein
MIWYVVPNKHWKRGDGFPVMKKGWGNGYVAVPPSHILYKKHYDEVYYMFEDEAQQISIHGGLTYSQFGDGENAPKDWWVFGFDTNHFQDDIETWPKEKVEEETLDLFWQLFELEWGEL